MTTISNSNFRYENFFNIDIFDVSCDLLVIPISTEGGISPSFFRGLEKLNVTPHFWVRDYVLGEVNVTYSKEAKMYLAFVCTVDKNESRYYVIRSIARELARQIIPLNKIKKIAIPLLGTGAGRLAPHYSFNIIRSAFYENRNVEGIILCFCTPDEESYELVVNYDMDIENSARMVIEAEMTNIHRHEAIERIQYTDEFYYDLAEEKFNEFINWGHISFEFFDDLSDKFKSSKQPFKNFIDSGLSADELEFTVLCGELIAYIDSNAYYKNIWNKYHDKRVLAKSSVHQNHWFLNLIKFKITNNFRSLSPSIANALLYLKYPDRMLTMLSEGHRKKVLDTIFPDRDSESNTEDLVLGFFMDLGITSYNPKNLGAICSRILYLPFIKPIWDEKESKIQLPFDRYLDYTDLSRIGFLIDQCLSTKSKVLDLGNCGLRDLTLIPELFLCTHIETLILSNEWGEYNDGMWRKAKSTNKGQKNNIQFIPESIKELSELKTLICGGDWKKSSNMEKEWNRWGNPSLFHITKLLKLEYLNLSNNTIKSIEGLNKLINLKFLHLNNNKISKIEPLNSLTKLKELNLSNNEIISVDFLKNLLSIETLDLHHNRIKDLRPIKDIIKKIGISNTKWELFTLNITQNPLEYPSIDFVDISTEAVLGSFEDIEKRGVYLNKDIKVILVGNSEVGKSTLLKYLDPEGDLEKDHHATLWMEEKRIKSKYAIKRIGEECMLRIFDFGGHDYYHDTHHLFFSGNTIYLLLWDKDSNKLQSRKILQKTKKGIEVEIETQDYPLKYWLDSVKYYTKGVQADNIDSNSEIKENETYDSELMVIQNKVEISSEIMFLENETLKNEYPFIFDLINIAIKPPRQRNLNHFDSLFTEMLDKMDIIGEILPMSYKPIIDSILVYSGKPVLTFNEFLDYCNIILNDEENPFDTDECKRLLLYLDRIGMLLYNNKYSSKIYIDKSWVIESMHEVLEKLIDKKGEFDKSYVATILGSHDNIDDLLLMMQWFKMIFKHPYTDSFIAPLYLPKLPDGKVNLFLKNGQIPYRRFEYNGFIHKHVILSIFEKFGKDVSFDKDRDSFYYWKDGLIIKDQVTEEIVMIKFHIGDEKECACIDIYDFTGNEKPNFPNKVLKYIREVNKGYDLEEMVTIDGIDYISIDVLEKNANVGKYIFSEKKLSDFKKDLLEEKYFNLKDYIDMKFIDSKIKKRSVVISYSKFDLKHVHMLERYLRPLVDWELIKEPWRCENLITGAIWDETIRKQFNEADIIFFLVSANLFSTKYVTENEITDAIKRFDNDNSSVKIVPIVLDYYEWGRKSPFNLQRFSAMPFKGKPVTDFKDQKVAWHTITNAVRIMIEHDLYPEVNGVPNREIQEIYERQVAGKLDNNWD
ncbi:Internalin-A precursor [compost metagenome]